MERGNNTYDELENFEREAPIVYAYSESGDGCATRRSVVCNTWGERKTLDLGISTIIDYLVQKYRTNSHCFYYKLGNQYVVDAARIFGGEARGGARSPQDLRHGIAVADRRIRIDHAAREAARVRADDIERQSVIVLGDGHAALGIFGNRQLRQVAGSRNRQDKRELASVLRCHLRRRVEGPSLHAPAFP